MDNWSKRILENLWDRASSLTIIIVFGIAAVAQLIVYVFDPKRKIENRWGTRLEHVALRVYVPWTCSPTSSWWCANERKYEWRKIHWACFNPSDRIDRCFGLFGFRGRYLIAWATNAHRQPKYSSSMVISNRQERLWPNHDRTHEFIIPIAFGSEWSSCGWISQNISLFLLSWPYLNFRWLMIFWSWPEQQLMYRRINSARQAVAQDSWDMLSQGIATWTHNPAKSI